MKLFISLSLILLLLGFTMHAQSPVGKLKLFIDCSSLYCDFNFIRQQIPVTDFVRDRKESDVHILIITQPAGNGGTKYNVLFLGQNSRNHSMDTLSFFTAANTTQNDVRQQLVGVLKAGIAPFLVKSGYEKSLNISFSPDSIMNQNSKSNLDPWNNWVFNIGGRARLSGDKNYREKNLGANASASRITKKSKFEFYLFSNTSRNIYNIVEDGIKSKLETSNDYFEVEQSYVKSISAKWSLGIGSDFRKSTYNNLKKSFGGSAGIEYNIYPYSLSTNKFLVLRYELEVNRRQYIEETIYNKISETLVSNNIGLYTSFTQPWGTIRSGISWYHYLHNFSRNNLSANADIALQLFKGVSFHLFGNASLIKDQLHLTKSGASAEEVLLRLKALSTTFNYYTGMGISYRFGSRYNNYVNPRFTNGNH